MHRSFYFICSLLFLAIIAGAQQEMNPEEAVARALGLQRNLRPAELNLKQQRQLLRGAAEVPSPQVIAEITPYEPLIVGIQQSFNLPGVYRNRRRLQSERIRLTELQLLGTQYDLKREVRLSYLQVQYLTERIRQLAFQDSVFQAIKISAQRFFAAGQINKLEELTATAQADRIRNDWQRAQADLEAELQLFRFYTGITDTVRLLPLTAPAEEIREGWIDTASNVQQQILQQQVSIAQRELRLQQSELGPQFYAGPLFPTTQVYERFLGFQAGVSLPLWGRQNRSRIEAGKTGIEVARAQRELEQQRLNTRYRQSITNLQRERRSLGYFNQTALSQAEAIIAVSRRLFQGGELNYIESLRNLINAFDLMNGRMDAHRAYGEALIELKYLNGTL